MTLFRWYDPESPHDPDRTWNNSVYADRIEFAPAHVVWRDIEHRLILALRNSRVDNLEQIEDEDDLVTESLHECGAQSGKLHNGTRAVCTFAEHGEHQPHSWQMFGHG